MHPNHTTNDIPYGYCQCGCGQLAPIATQTNSKYGYIKGKPKQFIYNHHYRASSDAEKFWSKVVIADDNECWLWQSSLSKDGYGMFKTCHDYQRKSFRAHRYAYELHNGPIPDGLLALHKCDNPTCVNPNHLFLGTQQDNIDDMIAKGRDNMAVPCPGERNAAAKLTEAQVIEIRRRKAAGESGYSLAKEFGVIQATISKIVLRKTWRHV